MVLLSGALRFNGVGFMGWRLQQIVFEVFEPLLGGIEGARFWVQGRRGERGNIDGDTDGENREVKGGSNQASKQSHGLLQVDR